jgi:hypothetical protein
MKKQLFTCFSILLVLTLLLAPTGSAAAAPLADGPSIYSTTDAAVDATVLEISELPGTVKLDNGAIYPVGHESGDLVFSGLGLQVSGLSGSAVIHMPVKNYTYGWTGSIYQYAFGGWIEVPSVITKDTESNDGTASATIYYDGIYAVLVHYVAPVVEDTGPDCPVYESTLYYVVDRDAQEIGLYALLAGGDFTSLGLVEGESVTYTIVNDNPLVTLDGATSGEAFIWLMEGEGGVYGFAAVMAFSPADMPIIEYSGEGLPYFTITVKAGGCTFRYSVTEEDYGPEIPS